MWRYKRKKGQQVKAVIHNDCYQRLPDTLKSRFYPAPPDSETTHVVSAPDKVGGYWLSDLATDMVLAISLGGADVPTENYSIETPDVPAADAGGNFGGGDGGGAGAGDSY